MPGRLQDRVAFVTGMPLDADGGIADSAPRHLRTHPPIDDLPGQAAPAAAPCGTGDAR